MWSRLFKGIKNEEILNRIEKLAQNMEAQFQSLNHHVESLDLRTAKQEKQMEKIETKQKETIIQLEDIDSFLQDDEISGGLPEALMVLVETIYDFFLYTEPDTPLFDQAKMMFDRAAKTAKGVGLEVVVDDGKNFDFRLHTAQGTENAHYLPDGHIVRTLQCGFIFKDEILRRAVVVVNKRHVDIEWNPEQEPERELVEEQDQEWDEEQDL